MTVEQLMNKLIEKGWRPFNKDIKEFFTLNEFTCGYRGEGTNHLGTIRAIVSKESGLWQFVCENGYIKEIETDGLEIRNWDNPKHWIVESALCDEDKLEEFLLSNIKIGNED